jgi:TgpA N-terminal domain/Transglutaminase-like superfamily
MTQDRRMTLTAAVAVVLVSSVLFPAFQGTGWFYEGIGAVLAVASFGMLSRLRTLPVTLCLLISLVGLLLYLNLVFEAGRSIIGFIPSSASMSGLWHLTQQGFSDARKYAAPAQPLTPLVLLAVGGIGITAVVTDLIAVRLRSAAMAGLPLLVLFTVPVAINANRGPVTIIVIFTLATIGYLSLLSADGRERIRVWGRLISLWRTSDGEPGEAAGDAKSPYRVLRGPDTRSLAAAGRRVGLASIILALCAPLLIPGLHSSRLTSSNWVIGPGTGLGGGPGLYDPLTAVEQDLKEAKPTTVFTYTTNAPASLQAPWLQQYVYTTLTPTTGWEAPSSATITTTSFNNVIPAQSDGISNSGAPVVQTDISISGTAGFPNGPVNFLPAPYPPSAVYDPDSVEYQSATLMLVQRDPLNGLDYRVVSHYVDPAASTLSALSYPPAMAADTQLPSSYTRSGPLLQLVLKLTDKKTTEYGKVTAVENWLNSGGGFTYDTEAPQIEDVSDLLNYLTNTKTGKLGDCVQSAFAMTVMLRMIGIPARLAVGFTQGKETSVDHYTVKSSDEHAWPEVFFRGYGWLAFSPTPAGQGSAIPLGYASTQTSGGSTSPSTGPVGGGQTGSKPGKPLPQTGRLRVQPDGGIIDAGVGPATTVKPPAGTPWLALVLAVLAAAGLTCWLIAALIPARQRALAARANAGPRLRVSLSTVLYVLGTLGVIALVLYRVLSQTKGLNLGSGWAMVGIAFFATCVVALAVPAVSRFVVRRWRWMRAADNDADLAHAAWEELRADLADYGVGYLPSESPRALAGRVTTKLALPESAVEAVNRIALAEERATYAARPSDAEGLRKDGSTARRAIAGVSGPIARWRARIFPGSTIAAIADLAARVPEAWSTRIRPRLPGRAREPRLES